MKAKTERGMRGVFWIVDGELLAFPFEEVAVYGVAKSGRTYNHCLLWEHVRPDGCCRPFDYYPRGRIEFSGKGRPIVYMSPYIGGGVIPQIMEAFSLAERPIVRFDGSEHYKCYLDRV